VTDWFRSWHGAPTDSKWLGIGRRAGVAPGIAVAVAWALMDRASQAEDRGSIACFDAEGLAYFFGCEPEQVQAIVLAMSEKRIIVDGRFYEWNKYQPKNESSASKRPSASVWSALRSFVFNRDNYTCMYCGERGGRIGMRPWNSCLARR
jgi:hypothetical protein